MSVRLAQEWFSVEICCEANRPAQEAENREVFYVNESNNMLWNG